MKKTLIWMMLAVMLLTGVLASCALDPNQGPGTNSGNKGETPVPSPDTDDLGDVDLGGRTVTIISRVEGVNQDELYAEELNSDPVNDAVFNRELALEQRLNCEMEVVQHIAAAGSIADEVLNEVSNMVISGTDDYHIVANASYTSTTLALQGRMTDLRQSQYIDFDKNYWSQGFNDALSYKDSQFFVTGPMSLSYYRYMFVTLFNKKMMKDIDQQDVLYEVAENGEWTIDYMKSIAEVFYIDLNGSASKDIEDQYGFCVRVGPSSSMMDGYWEGTDICVLKKTSDNEYAYEIDKDRLDTSVNAVLGLLDGAGTFVGGDGDYDILKKFANDQSAMIHYRLISVEDPVIRNMTNEYGILPMPKLSKAQEDYKTHVQVEVLLYGVPSTSYDEIDELGIFLEAYASESYRSVKPAYYEIALTSKYAKDPESVQMLDKIVHSVSIDPLNMYGQSFNFTSANIRSIHQSGTNTISSMVRRNETSIKKSLKKLNETLDKVIEQNS